MNLLKGAARYVQVRRFERRYSCRVYPGGNGLTVERARFLELRVKDAVEAAQGTDAPTLDTTSTGAIAVHQVAQLRRWMPSGDR